MVQRLRLWGTLVVLGCVTTTWAQQYEIIGLGTRVQGLLDVTAQSQYLWRGFQWFGNDAAWQVTGGMSLPEYGVGMLVSGHMGIGSGHVLRERWDASLYYGNTLAAGQPYETRYRLGWVYYNHPKLPQNQNDLQEGHVILTFPRILQTPGLVPSLATIKMWPGKGGALINNAGYAEGWLYVGNLDYIFSVPASTPEMGEQVVKLHSEITYNGGVNPVDGVPIKSGFSHAVFGGSTDYELGYGMTLTPGAFYQVTLEDTVNPDNEFWFTLGVRYQF